MQSTSNATPSAPNPPLQDPGSTPRLDPLIPLGNYKPKAGSHSGNSQCPHAPRRWNKGKDSSHPIPLAQGHGNNFSHKPPPPARLNLWQTATLFGLKESDVVALVDCGRLTPLFRDGVRMFFATVYVLGILQDSNKLREIAPSPVLHSSSKGRKSTSQRPKSPPPGAPREGGSSVEDVGSRRDGTQPDFSHP